MFLYFIFNIDHHYNKFNKFKIELTKFIILIRKYQDYHIVINSLLIVINIILTLVQYTNQLQFTSLLYKYKTHLII